MSRLCCEEVYDNRYRDETQGFNLFAGFTISASCGDGGVEGMIAFGLMLLVGPAVFQQQCASCHGGMR